ncbi:DegT/DnrJ/EryC1/StrS family aminotransferase [Gluconacetobacter azotocaptans]|uniref:DegT/DnrJ/EryC1/StrS family aminotransferase n=1 Tax=Gluconacetobacter azotocaptans TaxID=142834 RepID=UPI00195A9E4E|nr:aminotransferase class I/II-fold pyridoxal phosphate-dependent enzyme [Gluconacetobacter azotocaptans]MBM9403560.1 DegT/DnrJ/EryC1/StrS family aminotransferase [Gluconacetobacter azotocaptans]
MNDEKLLDRSIPTRTANIRSPRSDAIDIPVARPRLPTTERIEPYLRQIDANQWYTNQGPLCETLQERLGRFWEMDYDNVALVNSATTGLTLALRAHAPRPGSRCLMPSWTFTASAAAVTDAGLVPHFVDVDPDTWMPDPDNVECLARSPDIGAILIVVPFGSPIDLTVWDAVSQRTGRPVVIDAAAAFDTLRSGGPMRIGRSTVVISLHATKVFGMGEGGAVVSRDPALAEHIRALARFGFAGSRSAQHAGINGKISEYTAAVGLAGLDVWAETRSRWDAVTRLYHNLLPASVRLPPAFGRNWVSSTLAVICPEKSNDVAGILATHRIGTVSWWGTGCHTQPAYASCPREQLPMTQQYGCRAIGLPFSQDMTAEQVMYVCTTLRNILPAESRAPRFAASTNFA